MNTKRSIQSQRGTTLIELMVALAITMFMVTAAAYIYLSTTESQGAQERANNSNEAGAFALDLIGRDIENAGFYPSPLPATSAYTTGNRAVKTYPPALQGLTATSTDWIAPHAIYLAPIFGCDGALFDSKTATCAATVAGAPDSIVLNYFTSESVNFGATVGMRRDCTGSEIGNDPSNSVRKLNKGLPLAAASMVDPSLPPQQPLFASNFYGLSPTSTQVDGQTVTTQSLSCGGNGQYSFGGSTTKYYPLIAGVESLQFTYGVFNSTTTRTPDRFYTATQVNALATISVDGVTMAPWSRVVSVRVCILSKTLSSNTKLQDKSSALRSYLDCNDATVTQTASDNAIYMRQVQVFGLRNRLNQTY